MGDRAADINEKRRKTEDFFAGPTYGFWKPYALWNREIRIGPGFRHVREFEVTDCASFRRTKIQIGGNCREKRFCVLRILLVLRNETATRRPPRSSNPR